MLPKREEPLAVVGLNPPKEGADAAGESVAFGVNEDENRLLDEALGVVSDAGFSRKDEAKRLVAEALGVVSAELTASSGFFTDVAKRYAGAGASSAFLVPKLMLAAEADFAVVDAKREFDVGAENLIGVFVFQVLFDGAVAGAGAGAGADNSFTGLTDLSFSADVANSDRPS